jgi:hypothetical protein
MDSLKDFIRETLREKMYEATVVMRSDRGENLTIVTDNLRGVCGITVVTVLEPAQPVSETVEQVKLRVKFFISHATLKLHLKKMAAEARNISGIFSFQVLNVSSVQNRIYSK